MWRKANDEGMDTAAHSSDTKNEPETNIGGLAATPQPPTMAPEVTEPYYVY